MKLRHHWSLDFDQTNHASTQWIRSTVLFFSIQAPELKLQATHHQQDDKDTFCLLPSVWQRLINLMFAGTCMQPIQGSSSCIRRDREVKLFYWDQRNAEQQPREYWVLLKMHWLICFEFGLQIYELVTMGLDPWSEIMNDYKAISSCKCFVH